MARAPAPAAAAARGGGPGAPAGCLVRRAAASACRRRSAAAGGERRWRRRRGGRDAGAGGAPRRRRVAGRARRVGRRRAARGHEPPAAAARAPAAAPPAAAGARSAWRWLVGRRCGTRGRRVGRRGGWRPAAGTWCTILRPREVRRRDLGWGVESRVRAPCAVCAWHFHDGAVHRCGKAARVSSEEDQAPAQARARCATRCQDTDGDTDLGHGPTRHPKHKGGGGVVWCSVRAPQGWQEDDPAAYGAAAASPPEARPTASAGSAGRALEQPFVRSLFSAGGHSGGGGGRARQDGAAASSSSARGARQGAGGAAAAAAGVLPGMVVVAQGEWDRLKALEAEQAKVQQVRRRVLLSPQSGVLRRSSQLGAAPALLLFASSVPGRVQECVLVGRGCKRMQALVRAAFAAGARGAGQGAHRAGARGGAARGGAAGL